MSDTDKVREATRELQGHQGFDLEIGFGGGVWCLRVSNGSLANGVAFKDHSDAKSAAASLRIWIDKVAAKDGA